ncbi:DUF992 domain-containing protein [Rhizobium glycinendophyticum]|uniref:DUF992 domain-containing protein n=1 Tax=Rhizobium glycinendophyticum TaxID=2589807 RepID=A0A504UY32_9HYPH|nr:DUF992 domain-containing protein [Rhizobium glycinendophyticum]TPP11671.1 DUF992 domain-containing protein [Rhizobium glycinendophyticum]
MKTLIAASLAALPLLAAAGTTHAADMTYAEPAPTFQEQDRVGGVRIGYLDCQIGSGFGYVLGSAKTADCAFTSVIDGEPLDTYSGSIKKFGVDLGYTAKGRIIWAVFAPTAGYHKGSLGGLYGGATAEATIGAGVGANVLFGGTSGSIHLQPVSVTGQLGLNIAATGTSMTLQPAS